MSSWSWNYKNITTQTTTTVAAGPCRLVGITVNTGAASAVATVYDNASAGSGTKIATVDTSATGNFFYGTRCTNGLTIVTSGGNADITVSFE